MASLIFDNGSVTGAIVIAVASILAILCLLSVLLHMTFAVAASSYSSRMSSPQERYFITSPLGYYIVCLFLSNLLSALGGLLELQWVGPRAITQGPACTIQAFLVQLGSNAEALWLGVISISALRIFMFRARPWRKVVALPFIAALWIALIVINAVGSTVFHTNSLGFFYGASNIWCWITPRYTTARTLTYAWVWAWSLISAVCFLLVFLSVRGNIVVRRSLAGTAIKWRKRSFNSYAMGNGGEEYFGNLVGTVGKTMAWFPIVYITLSLPLGLSRVIESTSFLVPAYAMATTSVVYGLLGIANVFLYFAIRHSLKHSALHISSDTTLRGSYGVKSPTDSFVSPEKRPSRVLSDVWLTGPTTNEWNPPSQHLVEDHQARVASPSSTRSPRSPRPLPPLPSLDASTGDGSSAETPAGGRLLTVQEQGLRSGSHVAGVPPIAIPPAAVLPRDKVPELNIVSPVDMDKLANVPLTPTTDRKGSVGSLSNALAGIDKPASSAPTGPVAPPPRKARRPPITSMPVDVNESDEGSICSARPSVEAFPTELARGAELTRHISVGDVANRNPSTRRTRVDSMKSFWAAYEDSSPKTPTMPMPADAQTIRSRDTMRTFWAAYEDSSPRVPAFPGDLSRRPESSYPDSALSPDFKAPRMPTTKASHFSTVGGREVTKDDSELPPPVPSISSSNDKDKNEHRRSRSVTADLPKAPSPVKFSLTPSVSRQPSANAVDSSSKTAPTGLQIASALRNKGHSPTPSAGGTAYRPPRPQPGYL